MTVRNPSCERFELLAREYCKLIEVGDLPVCDFKQLRQIVSALYVAAQDLPEIEPTSSAAMDSLPGEEYGATCQRLNDFFKGRNIYWVIFDPLKDEVPVAGDLVDDLADIWRDLAQGLRALDTGLVLYEDVVWDWKFNFDTHWGKHAVDALPALHKLSS